MRHYAARNYLREREYEEDPVKKFNQIIGSVWEKQRPASSQPAEIREDEAQKDDKAKAAEYIALEGIDNYFWLGGNHPGEEIYVSPTSEHDDRERGTDCAVLIKSQAGKWLKLAIDVTTSKDRGEIEKKLRGTTEKLLHKQMPYIDDYQPISGKEGEESGRLEMPRIVIGVDREDVADLALNFLAKNQENLDRHLIQLEIIQEAIEQIISAVEILINRWIKTKKGDVNVQFNTPEAAINFIEEYLKTKQNDSKLDKMLNEHKEILEYLAKIQKEKSSLGEITAQRAKQSAVFRLLAPRKTNELLKEAV